MGGSPRLFGRVAGFLGETRQQNLLAFGGLVLGLAVVVTALVGDSRWARAGLALLLMATLVMLLDLRRRLGAIGRRVKQGAQERPRSAEPMLRDTGGEPVTRSDAMSRRLIAAVESGRLEAAERHEETLAALSRLPRDARSTGDAGSATATADAVGTSGTTDAPAPAARLSAQPDGLLDLVDLVQRSRPDVVVGVGSGSATVWLGYALRRAGAGRLVTIDHDEALADQTRTAVQSHDLGGTVDVRTARWADVRVGDETVTWYDPATLDGIGEIDLLVIDGASAPDGFDVRQSAVPVLFPRLADDALIVVHAGAAGPGTVIGHWQDRVDGLEQVESGVSGPSVLRYRRPSSLRDG